MAGTTTPNYLQAPVKNFVVQILPADTTANKTLCTGGTNGTKIECISVTSTDTSARDIALKYTVSGTDYIIGTVSIPITTGFTNAVPTVNLLLNIQIPGISRDNNGNPYLLVGNGTTLTVAALTTVTAAKAISFSAYGADF